MSFLHKMALRGRPRPRTAHTGASIWHPCYSFSGDLRYPCRRPLLELEIVSFADFTTCSTKKKRAHRATLHFPQKKRAPQACKSTCGNMWYPCQKNLKKWRDIYGVEIVMLAFFFFFSFLLLFAPSSLFSSLFLFSFSPFDQFFYMHRDDHRLCGMQTINS